MKKPKSNTLLVAVTWLLLLNITNQQILPSDAVRIPTTPVYHQDVLEYSLVNLFDAEYDTDWSEFTFEVTQTESGGSGGADISDLHISSPYTLPYYKNASGFGGQDTERGQGFFKLDDRSFLVIASRSKLFYYKTTPAAISTTSSGTTSYAWTLDLALDTGYTCQDVITLNNNQSSEEKGRGEKVVSPNFVVVACSGKEQVSQKHAFVVVDLKNGQIVSPKLEIASDLRITNQIKLLRYTDKTQTPPQQLLFYFDKIYNTPLSGAEAPSTIVGVLGISTDNKLTSMDPVTLVVPNLSRVNALYQNNNNLYLIGVDKVQSLASQNLTILGCDYEKANKKITCTGNYQTDIKVGDGAFQMLKNGNFISFHPEQDVIREYTITDPKVGPDFITLYDQTALNRPLASSLIIRYFEKTYGSILFGYEIGAQSESYGTAILAPRLSGSNRFTLLEKQEGALLHNNLWIISADTNDLLAFRIGTPFFWGRGTLFSPDSSNVVTIKATASQLNINWIARGKIYQLQNDSYNAPVKFNWNKPYSDAYDGSRFNVPFFSDNWWSGNNVKWTIQYDQSSPVAKYFKDSNVKTGFTVNSNLFYPPSEDLKNLKRVVFAKGAAVVQTQDGQLYFYSCEHPEVKVTPCQKKNHVVRNELKNQTLQREIVYDQGVILVWTKSTLPPKDGVKQKSYIVAVQFEGDQILFELDYTPQSLQFNIDGASLGAEINVASVTESNTVELRRLNIRNILKLDLIETLDKTFFGWDEFCPTQIQPDAKQTTFHILSACNTDGEGTGRDIIVGVYLRELILGFITPIVTSEVNIQTFAHDFKGKPLFCPMQDHYIVADRNDTTFVYAVDMTYSFSKYHKYIENLGYSQIDKLECFPGVQAYTVLGGKNYGLFDGSNKQDPFKFVVLLQNMTNSFDHYDSYNVGRDIILRVEYPATEKKVGVPNYYGIYQKPPKIYTDIEQAPRQDISNQTTNSTDEGIVLGYTLTGEPQNGGIGGTSKANLTFRVFNDAIVYKVLKYYVNQQGLINIEDYTEVLGPVKRAYMTGKVGDSDFYDRHVQSGAMESFNNSMVFKKFRGSPFSGVGLSFDNQVSLFSWIQNETVIKTKTSIDVVSMDQVLVQGNNTLVFYSTKYNQDVGLLSCFIFLKGQENYECESSYFGYYADKIRVVRWDFSHYMIFAMNSRQKELSCFGLEFTGNSIAPTKEDFYLIRIISGVIDFDATRSKFGVDLFFVKTIDELVGNARFTRYNNTDRWNINEAVKFFSPNEKTPYYLSSIAAFSDFNGTTNHIAVNTFGTSIFTFDQEVVGIVENQTIKDVKKLDKFINYEGSQLIVSRDWVLQRASSIKEKDDTQVFFWRRNINTSSVYTAVDLSNFTLPTSGDSEIDKKDDNKPKNGLGAPSAGIKSLKAENNGIYVDYPIAFFLNQEGEPQLAAGTSIPKIPLYYFAVGPMKFRVPTETTIFDYDKLTLFIEGTKKINISIQDLLTGNAPSPFPKPTAPTMSPWPFVGLLVILVLLSVGWFVYTRAKSAELETEYFSMQPPSKTVENEDEEDAELEENAKYGRLRMQIANEDEDDEDDERLG